MLHRDWPILAVVVVQLGVLVAVPARRVVARVHGTGVTLRTAPVDPYDVLSGYYVTLAYEVERPGDVPYPADLKRGEAIWLLVQRDEPAWRLAGVSRESPGEPLEGFVALRARWMGWRAGIEGAGRLYIPEARREEADRVLREHAGEGLVDLRVLEDGTAALVRLRVGGAVFGER
ncbi:MAG: GDYXXLXY domain-containing protein [Planctomycetes bacterium]|nr:GDYXXLXY domain-containing protein [Planctomycetota bacterium]